MSKQPLPIDQTEYSTEYTGEPIAAMKKFIADKSIKTTGESWRTNVPKPPKIRFEEGKKYFWVLQTSEGTIKIQLMPDVAPMHVSSTVYLTLLGFYDSLIFHRVIPGFMAQGGDPLGNGSGGPAYTYGGEFSPDVRHDRKGLLSMANAGPGTDGSQFFITFTETPWLDNAHTIFGEVKDGFDTLSSIESLGSSEGATSKTITIEKATITVE
tara:strand:+ start:1918 stop:2550 length:633 start_codon:yes stop_codon:yes gene_type:complete